MLKKFGAVPVVLVAARRKPTPPSTPPARPIFPRAVVLLILLACLDLWTSRHLGIGLSRRPAWLGVIGASWVAATALLDRALADEEKKSMAKRSREALRRLLTTPFLIGLAFVLAVLCLGYSSIRVLGDAEARGAKLAPFTKEQHPGWAVAGDPGRFLVLGGSSSGRAYRLTVPGYLPSVLTVPAFTGLEILPERDLRKSPSLLLRPLPTILGLLQDGGSLEIWMHQPEGLRRIAREACGCRASFLLGRKQPVPADALSRWSLELRALNAAPEGSSLSQTLLAWNRPRYLVPAEALLPGTRLEVRVLSREGARFATTTLTVTEESLQDVLLLPE